MSVKPATRIFIAQRATAVLLLPLVAWLLWSLVAHAGADYAAARAWASEPLNAGLTAALILVAAAHMRIGLAEVIEDYIHTGLKGVFMTLNWLVALAVAGAGLFAAFQLVFAG
jgi:succinate dehydrogenase / fumarate reductase membrane anchor subunit